MKPITFLGDSLEEIQSFPPASRRTVGFQLDRVQRGMMPENWKPMKTVGQGVYEIRVSDGSGAYRVLYVATFPEVVYVLHAFRKKTKKTSKSDLQLAESRLKELLRNRK
jgi:phage-related protein